MFWNVREDHASEAYTLSILLGNKDINYWIIPNGTINLVTVTQYGYHNSIPDASEGYFTSKLSIDDYS